MQGTSVCQVTVIGAIVILLYASRACYNLVVLGLSNKSINAFDYDWYNVSDQVSHHHTSRCILMSHGEKRTCSFREQRSTVQTS